MCGPRFRPPLGGHLEVMFQLVVVAFAGYESAK